MEVGAHYDGFCNSLATDIARELCGVGDRGLWESFQRAMGTQLMMSTAFHPQTDSQLERTIQTLEDMLRACALGLKGSWEEHLALVEFAYNNSYQASI